MQLYPVMMELSTNEQNAQSPTLTFTRSTGQTCQPYPRSTSAGRRALFSECAKLHVLCSEVGGTRRMEFLLRGRGRRSSECAHVDTALIQASYFIEKSKLDSLRILLSTCTTAVTCQRLLRRCPELDAAICHPEVHSDGLLSARHRFHPIGRPQ